MEDVWWLVSISVYYTDMSLYLWLKKIYCQSLLTKYCDTGQCIETAVRDCPPVTFT
jgi:hypothetical protein